jgi:hypothetical protein
MGEAQRAADVTVDEDAQAIAGALAAGYRDDDDGMVTLFGLLDGDVHRLLHAFVDLDGALIRTLAEKQAQAVSQIVDSVTDSLEGAKADRASRTDVWPPEVWDAAVLVLRVLGDVATASTTTTIDKPPDVEAKAWLAGWYVVAWALTIEIAEHEGVQPEEMAQSVALNYANWAAGA